MKEISCHLHSMIIDKGVTKQEFKFKASIQPLLIWLDTQTHPKLGLEESALFPEAEDFYMDHTKYKETQDTFHFQVNNRSDMQIRKASSVVSMNASSIRKCVVSFVSFHGCSQRSAGDKPENEPETRTLVKEIKPPDSEIATYLVKSQEATIEATSEAKNTKPRPKPDPNKNSEPTLSYPNPIFPPIQTRSFHAINQNTAAFLDANRPEPWTESDGQLSVIPVTNHALKWVPHRFRSTPSCATTAFEAFNSVGLRKTGGDLGMIMADEAALVASMPIQWTKIKIVGGDRLRSRPGRLPTRDQLGRVRNYAGQSQEGGAEHIDELDAFAIVKFLWCFRRPEQVLNKLVSNTVGPSQEWAVLAST
ncbi:hypothetical protein QYF36_014136 [Acer negundo]|nr:hypothetical protein QYF36_014136 [Acer negundo]